MFEEIGIKIKQQIVQWEQKFNVLTNEQVTISRNSQNRSVKEILGHLIDSASNNIHRVVHLQYQKPPVDFPNYATYGNNDRWISIQNYRKKTGITWFNSGNTQTFIFCM